MAEQFENPQAEKLEDDTIEDASPQKKIDHIADKAAEKSGQREKNFDKDHDIFSR